MLVQNLQNILTLLQDIVCLSTPERPGGQRRREGRKTVRRMKVLDKNRICFLKMCFLNYIWKVQMCRNSFQLLESLLHIVLDWCACMAHTCGPVGRGCSCWWGCDSEAPVTIWGSRPLEAYFLTGLHSQNAAKTQRLNLANDSVILSTQR